MSVLGAFANGEQFQMATQAAEMFASSNMVPATYQGNPGSCFIALNTALRMKLDPLMVMQNLYVVKGRPSWSGQFAIAVINGCGKYTMTWFECKNGTDYKDGVRMCAQLPDGNAVRGSWITPEMVKAEGWGQKWQTMPEQMYQYRAAAFFARTNCPEALMGLLVEGEAEDVSAGAQLGIKPPLFKEVEKGTLPNVKGDAGADAARQMETASGVELEVPPPHVRLMEALSCTEEQLDALIARASGGAVTGWRELKTKQLEKLASHPERLKMEGGDE